ncbi:MAG: class I SAM-dependent methyltransferase, partial [Thermomicrobiales bacterium]|nr:class I SAM-dependent methyltransferase [Thermomicrobiales bacterium]
DHCRLIARGFAAEGGVWADLGSGTGAFTLALRDLAVPEVEIWSVDRDASALRSQRDAMERLFPGTRLNQLQADFTRPLELPPLDGIVAANSIHFVRDRVSLLRDWRGYLKPGGRIVLVEYDTDRGNHWVPYPVAFTSLAPLARAAGFAEPVLLHAHPSRFNDRIYSALLTPTD